MTLTISFCSLLSIGGGGFLGHIPLCVVSFFLILFFFASLFLVSLCLGFPFSSARTGAGGRCWGLLSSVVGFLLSAAFRFCCIRVSFMGSGNGGRFGTVSHSQWSSGRTTAPANPNICTLLAGPCGGLFFVLRVSLTPLTDYLILPFTAFPSSPLFICLSSPCSLRLGYLVRYTVC